MKFNMERRQKYFEDVLRKQQRQIGRISKELELHREFLGLQFESFMDFLFQHGGQIIKNGKEEGVFFPMKKPQNGNVNNGEDAHGDEDAGEEQRNGDNKDDNDQSVNGVDGDGNQITKLEEDEETGNEGDEMDPLPPPQAILGSPAGADGSEEDDNEEGASINGNHANYHQKMNGSRLDAAKDGQNSSRRSSQNVVSSSDAQNGDNDEDYEDGDADSQGEYESNNGIAGQLNQADMLKYVQSFMFSHFLDGGANNANEDNGMDDSYNDDDMGGYEGEDDDQDIVESTRPFNGNINRQHPSWTASSNSMRNAVMAANLQQLAAKQVAGNGHNSLPIPNNNIPHNERTCRYCGKTFHWKQSWVIHERTHTGEKPYLCKCGKAFSQKSNMNTHAKSCAQAMTTQKGKTTVFQMKCSHCQKMFTHKKNLDLHMEKFHPEVLNLSVKPSTSASSSPTSSSLHHFQDGLDAEAAAAAARAAAENAAILNILKTVSSQVAANNAGKSNSNNFSSSVSSHSNENSMSGSEDKNGRYPCHYCPKRFPVKGTLERHLRVHTGEKPFLCGICGKAFTQKGSVKLHLERVHRQTM